MPIPTCMLFSDRLLLLPLRPGPLWYTVLHYSCCTPRLNGGTLVRTGSMEGSFPSLVFTGRASVAGSMNCLRVSALSCLCEGAAPCRVAAPTDSGCRVTRQIYAIRSTAVTFE